MKINVSCKKYCQNTAWINYQILIIAIIKINVNVIHEIRNNKVGIVLPNRQII